MAQLIMQEEASDPTTPGSGKWSLYPKANGLYVIDDAGHALSIASPDFLSHSPVITQKGSAVSYTLTLSKYQVIGKRVDWMFRFDFTGAGGSSGSDTRIAVTLPITGFYSLYDMLLSSNSFYDLSDGTFYNNNIVTLNGSGNSFATTPGTVVIASGDSFFGFVSYFLP